MAENSDPAVAKVVSWFRSRSKMNERFGDAIRQGLDEVIDGPRTGRFSLDELSKVEKTYVGTKVEIIVREEFGLSVGQRMDYRVAGEELDAKWSKRLGGWMIPTEAVGQLCLCMTADDSRSVFSVGVVRAIVDHLRDSKNQDRKRQLNGRGRLAIVWLADEAQLPENLLLHLPNGIRDQILAPALSGQGRVTELFRSVQGRLVRRQVVLTVAQQADGPKRVRDARRLLRSEGVLILGHQRSHRGIAQALALPVPAKGNWVSCTVVPTDETTSGAVRIGRSYWRLAGEEDKPCYGPEGY